MNYDFLKTIWKGIKSFLIALAVVALGGIVTAFTNYQPEAGMQTYIWQIGGASLIGGLTALLNWLKNKDK